MAADTGALRTRRSRAHARGDHSLCLADRCEVARDRAAEAALEAAARPDVPPRAARRTKASAAVKAEPVTTAAPAEPPDGDGPLAAMARAMVDSLPYAASDPRRLIGELAVALGRKLDADGAAPPAVRELRTLLMQIIEVPNQPAGFVDEIRLRRAHRRLDAILANVERGMVIAADTVAEEAAG